MTNNAGLVVSGLGRSHRELADSAASWRSVTLINPYLHYTVRGMLGWLRRRPPRPDLHVVMFTRRGCHLCDDAWEILKRHQKTHGFTLEAKDVDASPAWARAYGDWVPVVLFNDKVRFRGRVNEVLLQRELNALGAEEATG